jgi:hypothetical protein
MITLMASEVKCSNIAGSFPRAAWNLGEIKVHPHLKFLVFS